MKKKNSPLNLKENERFINTQLGRSDLNNKGALNYSKYGFIKHVEKNGLIEYKAEISGEVILLIVLGDTHTLKIGGKRNIMVANRYKVSNQNELDFLLLNGRTAPLFKIYRTG